MTRIRVERADDAAAVRAVHAAAFGDDVVPVLVDRLRVPGRDAGPQGRPAGPSFVAELDDGTVVGHVLVTPADLERAPGDVVQVPMLSPLGVHPAAQGRGVGRALLDAVLVTLAERGEACVILEGDPRLYGRFGFERASAHGLRRPSERIPEAAFQVHRLDRARPVPRGRVLYPEVFWDLDAVGLPFASLPWLDVLERSARAIEGVCSPALLDRPVPTCPGWTLGDLLVHLGAVCGIVGAWIDGGSRPRPGTVPLAPADGDAGGWFAAGWRALHARLDALAPDAEVASWCPWDTSGAFWRRRIAHELAIHAVDVARTLAAEPAALSRVPGRWWALDEAFALDGVDEVLRLWLGTRLGSAVGGRGDAVRVATGHGAWTVGLHPRHVEVHGLPVRHDAVVAGAPQAVYRWLWGRAPDTEVELEGDAAALAVLRDALGRATA